MCICNTKAILFHNVTLPALHKYLTFFLHIKNTGF